MKTRISIMHSGYTFRENNA